MSKKVDIEVAENDFNRFVEMLNLSELKLAKLEEEKEEVIRLIEYGYFEVGEDLRYNFEEPLKSPSGDIDHIKFAKQKRFAVKDIERLANGSKSDIETARRMLGAITGLNSGLIKEHMSGDDFVNLGKISAFFLPR